MTESEFQEILKTHIVGRVDITTISKTYNFKKHTINDRMHKYSIKSNRVCLKPAEGYSYCSRCRRILPLDKFSNHGWCQSCLSLNEEKRKLVPRIARRKSYNKRVSDLKIKYSLSEDSFRDMQDAQRGCCKICGSSLEKPQVDHNHKTGAVRGLLCSHCNIGLGQFKDDEESLKRAIIYLKEYQ